MNFSPFLRPAGALGIASAILCSALLPLQARADGNPQTPVSGADLDAAAFSHFVEGVAQSEGLPKEGPLKALWTRENTPDFRGTTFGESAVPGVRHLRFGFKSPQAVGSVMVRGGGRLFVLKADAEYPGDVTRESDWIGAERLRGTEITTEEAGHEEVAIWNLPPGTTTRALRFTHTAQAADPRYAGWLGGALILAERFANIAPQAVAGAGSREEAAGQIANGYDEQWKAWDNGKGGAAQPVSAEHPESVLLVWPQPVTFAGLQTIGSGYGAADVQVYVGPKGRHPREGLEADWKTIRSVSGIKDGYPLAFSPSGFGLPEAVTTRALRLRLTAGTAESHPHLKGNTKEGRRVWLSELLVLQTLGNAPLKTALLPASGALPHPPIPVRFTLAEPGFVTLVIEDSAGKRVRNLVSEMKFPAGENIAWWDGTDDVGRDRDAARHGLYHIPEQPVAPGDYAVRGLFHKGVELRYEFSIYNSGNPAWETSDKSGGWLTNHSAPQAALFVSAEKSPTKAPLMYLGSAVSEGGAGLAWVDMEGKKIGGRGWIGGNWTAAPYLTRDEGKSAVDGVFAYVGATWTSSDKNEDKTHGELRLTALTASGDKAVLKYPFTPPAKAPGSAHADDDWVGQLGGIAARDGLLVAALHRADALVFVDARTGKALGETPIKSPRGLAFDAEGRLLVLSGKQLLSFSINAAEPAKLATERVLIAKGLLDPRGITLDAAGLIYISDQGASHQVKVFSAEGKLLRTIGEEGAPKAGPYNALHMNHPHGLAIDEKGQLWVAENDFQPKRVSVWSAEGKLLRAFYGPGRYGGGGSLDPHDKRRFYYDGIEFELDWKSGDFKPVAVFHRPEENELSAQFRSGPPETPLYFEGRQYMTNAFNSNPTGGPATTTLWRLDKNVTVPVASMGRASDWPLLKSEEFASRCRWPESSDPKTDRGRNQVFFAWNDLNDDARAQPEEVTLLKGSTGGVTVQPDLSFAVSRLEDRAMRFAPRGFSPKGAPLYDLARGETLVAGAQNAASSGGDQVLTTKGGWSVLTIAPQPWARESLGGVKDGVPLWSYPSPWPGLHASHEAPVPDRPGQLIGTTRLLGGLVTPKSPSDAGPLFCINGNMGNAYLLTVDGLFVAQLFEDSRTGKPWSMPKAERGMLLNGLTLHDENFFPSITQASDGRVYMIDGARTSLVRVDGLEAITRLPASRLSVTAENLQSAAAWRVQAEAQRQAARGSGSLKVALRPQAPQVDGSLEDWAGADWAVIDRRGTAANFNSDSKPYDVSAAVSVSGDRLFAAFRTQDAELLKNSGETPNAPFKNGGCLDLMIGANAAADPKRPRPVAGDARLLITQIKGKTLALVYRAVVPGTREPVPFSSPWRTINIDSVEDISAQVQLAAGIEKNAEGKVKAAYYEVSVPLAALGLKPAEGQAIKGDVGILRGNGFQTLQRVYWNNKATAITADVPSEAELTPALWGRWVFGK